MSLVTPLYSKICNLIDTSIFQVRVSLASSRIIPVPKAAEETMDFKSKELYVENVDKDTINEEATKVCYLPFLPPSISRHLYLLKGCRSSTYCRCSFKRRCNREESIAIFWKQF